MDRASQAASVMDSTEYVEQLQSKLLRTKAATDEHVLVPNQAYARGGIGVLLATNQARGPLNRLPQAVQAAKALQQMRLSFADGGTGSGSSADGTGAPFMSQRQRAQSAASTYASELRGTSMAGTRRSYTSSARAGSISASTVPALSGTLGTSAGQAMPDVAKHEWEKGFPHAYNFVSATRTTRTHDVRPASKWAAVSFYESDPKAISHHMTVMDTLEQQHAQSKYQERADERERHRVWAERQRSIFRRQRSEQASRYNRSGMPAPEVYAWSEAVSALANSARPRSASQAEQLDSMQGFTALPDDANTTTSSPRPGHHVRTHSAYSMATSRGRSPGTMTQAFTSCSGSGWGGGPGGPSTGATMGGDGGMVVPALPLPKPAFHQVRHRMAYEAQQAIQTKAAALVQREVERKQEQEQADVQTQLRHLDEFEYTISDLARRTKTGRYIDPRLEASAIAV